MASPEELNAFLYPSLAATHDPHLLKGMGAAVDRIERALLADESICIYGDYDVDGITATAIVKLTFDFLGADVATYIPHRLNEGYGLHKDAIGRLAERGVKLIVTVDNGITALDEIRTANELGLDVVVTDHHQPERALPPAVAVVNPNQPGCEYPFSELCGAGVAFKLCHALLKRLAPDAETSRPFLTSLLDLVALGTVADVVPLVGENRVFVHHGLRIMRETPRLGLDAMLKKIKGAQDSITADRLSYTIAPRLNAAGRTDRADYALDLLLSEDAHQAAELAQLLESFNEERRKIEAETVAEALAKIDENSDDPVIVVGGEDWHPGVVGIVASRLVSKYHRPAIVFGIEDDEARGSARSIKGFNLHRALEECRDSLTTFGGHPMAAGLSLSASRIPEFREAIQRYARGVLTEERLTPTLSIDATADPEEITIENVLGLDRLRPFGEENPRPVFAIEGLMLTEEPRVLKEAHLKLRLTTPKGRRISAIGFSQAWRYDALTKGGGKLRIAATPTINTWGGRSQAELEIADIKIDRD